jgi:hypothetical protein
MANADGTIRVDITGDAKDLQKAVGTADKSVGGLASSISGKGLVIGAAFAGAGAAAGAFALEAIGEADRVGDAMTRLEGNIGDDLAGAIEDVSSDLHDLGLSKQDVLELAAAFSDAAVAAGLSDDKIGALAPKAAELAGAMSLITDLTPDEVIAAIGKAADGSDKALKVLGINLSEAEIEARALQNSGKDTPAMLTDTEKAAAGYELVLERLAPKLADVTEGTGDFESKTRELDAKLEELTGKIGGHIEGPLTDLLDWALAGIEGFEDLGKVMEKDAAVGVEVFGLAILKQLPIAGDLLDIVLDINGAAKDASRSLTEMYQSTPNPDRRDGGRSSEAGVVQAIRDYERRNGIQIL